MKYPITNKYGETVEPTGHIRERIAACISASRPSLLKDHYGTRLIDPVGYFLFTHNEKDRAFYEERWADNLLVALANVGVKFVDDDEGYGT